MADPAAAPTQDDKTRYETLKKELTMSLPKKRAIDKQLAHIEYQIYTMETNYLTDTAVHGGGNIIQGFENYLKNQGSGRRRNEIHDQDRIFSNSSLTYQKSLDLLGEGEEAAAAPEEYVKQPTPGVTTIAVPPATRTQELTVAQQKKIKDREYQRKKRASMSHRSQTGESEEELINAASVSSRRPTKRARLADDD
ncbi:histone acetyltransferase subunit NuA4-domain-containing protein [Gymnopilus junonius]|uniref:Chromatin modification-related protein EAF6 n=1 Tax=Gymnopilus junonius TaxID=109634 RepID=A0A9P5NJB6_GYMJU|nr:histone acetyltransferase subunit NuA4-domain-containing protein [Gymnopilus junonius]